MAGPYLYKNASENRLEGIQPEKEANGTLGCAQRSRIALSGGRVFDAI